MVPRQSCGGFSCSKNALITLNVLYIVSWGSNSETVLNGGEDVLRCVI